MSSIINKVKDALHHDKTDTTHTTGTSTTHTSGVTGNHNTSSALSGSTNHGPHDSNIANKADPRIDSDHDGRAAHSTGLGSSNTHSTGLGSSNTTAGAHSTGLGSSNTHSTGLGSSNTTAGPHSSNLANKADPRVDSDLDGSNRHTGTGVTGTGYGSTNTHSTGLGSSNTHSTGAYNSNTNATAGPHSSNLANKVDPRVDSDLDGSKRVGGTTGTTGTSGYSGTHAGNHTGTHTGTHGGISSSTNAGPHDSNLANKADPRVDSDLDGKGNRHGANTGGVFGASGSHATAGSGTAQNTAGPHNSDLLNKIDPRVDSDRDGSKTYGGNATHQ
ncbi:hypothetical protein DL95DRAFT_396089 [Leptodontidium sp. 2 PMI_412]|nr:hypothetical protein DL95DRAFT_396089 [Leptodontidium sp. 2 PMI_412]